MPIAYLQARATITISSTKAISYTSDGNNILEEKYKKYQQVQRDTVYLLCGNITVKSVINLQDNLEPRRK